MLKKLLFCALLTAMSNVYAVKFEDVEEECMTKHIIEEFGTYILDYTETNRWAKNEYKKIAEKCGESFNTEKCKQEVYKLVFELWNAKVNTARALANRDYWHKETMDNWEEFKKLLDEADSQ